MMKTVKGHESRLPAHFACWQNGAEAGFSLISVRKCSLEAPTSSHTTPIISPPCRYLRVSIYRALFKLCRFFSVSVLTPLFSCLSALTVFNSLAEVILLPWERWEGTDGIYENNLVLLTPCWRRPGERNVPVGPILCSVIVCKSL